MASYGRPAIDRLLGLREPSSTLTTSNASLRSNKTKAAKQKPSPQKESRDRFGEPVTARRAQAPRSGRAGVQSEAPRRSTGSVKGRSSGQDNGRSNEGTARSQSTTGGRAADRSVDRSRQSRPTARRSESRDDWRDNRNRR